jgi:hypothetical protein
LEGQGDEGGLRSRKERVFDAVLKPEIGAWREVVGKGGKGKGGGGEGEGVDNKGKGKGRVGEAGEAS